MYGCDFEKLFLVTVLKENTVENCKDLSNKNTSENGKEVKRKNTVNNVNDVV